MSMDFTCGPLYKHKDTRPNAHARTFIIRDPDPVRARFLSARPFRRRRRQSARRPASSPNL